MEQVRLVSGSRMSRRDIVPAQDAQSRSLEGFEQLSAGPQTEALRQVGKDQPPLTAKLQMLGQRPQESVQHSAFGIVDSVLHGRARPRGDPWRVADNERRATFRKEVCLHHVDALRKPEPAN